MSAAALFFTGLTTGAVAGGASCAAVQGGLLAGAVNRRRAGVAAVAAAHRRRSKSSTRGSGRHRAAGTPTREAPGDRGAASLAAFLSAKLVSHTLLGAVLGAIGAAAQPSPRTRAILLMVAAAIMVIFASDLLGLKVVRGLVPRAPEAWTRRVRRSSRSSSMFTPALLGFLTVLLPCGVTLSVSLLAITSSSPVAGAAVMAGFVLGTMPLFTLLGFLLRQSTRVLQGRLSIVTGLVVLAVAAWTVNSALKLGGWAPEGGLQNVSAAASAEAVRSLPDGSQVVTLNVKSSGYSPSAVAARPGVPTTLVLQTQRTNGCTRAFVVPSSGVQQVLPETGRTIVDLGRPAVGTLKFTCGMGMYSGRIVFQSPGAPAAEGAA